MKHVIKGLYALVLSALVLYLFWLLQPIIVKYPIISSIALFLLVPTALGSMLRSAIEITLLLPLAAMVRKWNIPPVVSYYVFILALVAGVVIPWFHGIKGFGIWEWVASILYTFFIFETFLSFSSGILHTKPKE